MIKGIDLFAGAGGLSYGFLLTGQFQMVAAAEINKNAQETYKKNIVSNPDEFEFIDNVIDYDFAELNNRLGKQIDVVIGGPPCQGFSNANRQKNHLISMNNGLVKEYFRAIKQISPKAFVMENVSMLRSDTHRFYESTRDKEEIDSLIELGFDIPKREDSLLLSKEKYAGIDMLQFPNIDLETVTLPEKLTHLLSVLKKNIGNERRLPNFLKKNSNSIAAYIDKFDEDDLLEPTEARRQLSEKLQYIRESIELNHPENAASELSNIISLQKLIDYVQEIRTNGLIGKYVYSEDEGLRFVVNSYSVIDYVNAILRDQYIQKGKTVNAEWFGVPQDRRRYIIVGIRKDVYENKKLTLSLPEEPEIIDATTVGDAINDLMEYDVGYESDYTAIPYVDQENITDYAHKMRAESNSVRNHIATKTTEKAMGRFKKIKPGKNFHSLDINDKDTYLSLIHI